MQTIRMQGAYIREMKSGDSVKYMIVNPRLKDFGDKYESDRIRRMGYW